MPFVARPDRRGDAGLVGLEGLAVAEGFGDGETGRVGMRAQDLEPETARLGPGQADMVGQELRHSVRLFEGPAAEEA